MVFNMLLDVIDNSGVKQILYIGNLSKKNTKKIKIGDIIIGVVKKIKKNSPIKISSIVRAIVVTSKTFLNIKDGSYIKFKKNSVILISKKNIPIGTRILETFYYKKLYYNLLKIKSIFIS